MIPTRRLGRHEPAWHKDKSALCHGEVRILIFDDPAELEAWQRPKFRSAKFNNMKITMKIAMKISPRMILNVELPRRMILNFQNWKTTCTDYCSKYSCIDLQVV